VARARDGRTDDRKQREARFQDLAYTNHTREKLWPSYYAIVGSSREFYKRYLLAHCPGADVLEYGSGLASKAFLLADHDAASVTGIDISPVAVEAGNRRAKDEGYQHVSFQLMDGEAMEFDSDAFDLVCGTSVIHHLNLRRALTELGRVLRPGGSEIFIEPLGHNPLINLYRRRTPELRSPDEHPLLMGDLELASEFFGVVRSRFVHLTSLAAVPFRGRACFSPMMGLLDGVDRALFRAVPPLRRYAWQVVLELSEPKSKPQPLEPTLRGSERRAAASGRLGASARGRVAADESLATTRSGG
jgi:SAM-dependent methyltransferase